MTNFVKIERIVYNNVKISIASKIVYGVISSLSNKSGHCFATNSYLSKSLDVTIVTIQRALKELKDENIINIVHGRLRKIYINKEIKNMEKNNFIMIENSIIKHDKLTSTAKVVYGLIYSLCNIKLYSDATNAYLANEIGGTSSLTIQRALKNLSEFDLIRIEYIYGNSTKHIKGRKIYINTENSTLVDSVENMPEEKELKKESFGGEVEQYPAEKGKVKKSEQLSKEGKEVFQAIVSKYPKHRLSKAFNKASLEAFKKLKESERIMALNNLKRYIELCSRDGLEGKYCVGIHKYFRDKAFLTEELDKKEINNQCYQSVDKKEDKKDHLQITTNFAELVKQVKSQNKK